MMPLYPLQKDMLLRVRKDAAREDFENRNCGHFTRIFPPEDKYRREKYTFLLSEAFGIFMSGRASGLQAEMQKIYNNDLRVFRLTHPLYCNH